MKLRVDALILKRLFKVFRPGDYSLSFSAHLGDPGHVTACAYDGIKFIRATFDALVSEEGEAILSSKYLDRVERLEGEVLVRCFNEEFLLKDKLRPFYIPVVGPTGPYAMPENKVVEGIVSLTLDALKLLVRRVKFATGVMKSANLDCILFKFGGCIKAIGCDRRSVAVAKTEQTGVYEGQFILDKQAADVIGLLDGGKTTLTFYNGGGNIEANRGIGIQVEGDITFHVYIPERSGSFVSYEGALSPSMNSTLVVKQPDMMSVIADMRLHSDEMEICLAYESYVKRAPRFKARDAEGAHMARYTGTWEGNDIKLKVNARVIEQAIENISGEVTFGFSNHQGAYSIRAADGRYMAILKPYANERK